MNELTFRRILAGQKETKPTANDAEEADVKALEDEVCLLDELISNALEVEQPDTLQQQLLDIPNQVSKSSRAPMAVIMSLAASVVLAVSVLLFTPQTPSNFINEALAHSAHQHQFGAPITLAALNQQLVNENVSLTDTIGHVYFAKTCELANKTMMHIAIMKNGQPISVYILPKHSRFQLTSITKDKQFATPLQKDNRAFYIVGDSKDNVTDIKQSMDKYLNIII